MKRKFRKDFDCFEAVFGGALGAMIDSASIIVLERYYKLSTLESHRVDPLLLKGKVIVSTHSYGELADAYHVPTAATITIVIVMK
jgi:hypothetical protein